MQDTLDRRTTIKQKIKNELEIGSKIKIKINLGRNKYEHIEGIIKEKYDNHFILLTPNGMIRSFTYVDILIRNIIIKKN